MGGSPVHVARVRDSEVDKGVTMSKQLSRRSFLRYTGALGASLGVGAFLAACGGDAIAPTNTPPKAAAPASAAASSAASASAAASTGGAASTAPSAAASA